MCIRRAGWSTADRRARQRGLDPPAVSRDTIMEITWWTKPTQLDAEQRKVLALPAEGSRLVLGPPGSGKTNLLLLRASYLHRLKVRNIAIITLGRVLREFLATGLDNYPFSGDKIQTYYRWATTLLRDNGISFTPQGGFKAIRASLLIAMQDLAKQQRPENVFDCLSESPNRETSRNGR